MNWLERRVLPPLELVHVASLFLKCLIKQVIDKTDKLNCLATVRCRLRGVRIVFVYPLQGNRLRHRILQLVK